VNGQAATVLTSREPAAAAFPALLYLAARSRDVGAVVERLGRAGVVVAVAGDAAEALALLEDRHFSLCLVDLADERRAVPSIRALRAQHPSLPMMGLIDPARPLVAAEAIHAGVVDLLSWPFDEADVAVLVANVEDQGGDGPLDADTVPGASTTSLFAQSAAMRLIVSQVREAAEESRHVLVCGEPGSGRERVARAIHAARQATGAPFLRIDCAADGSADLEQTLFGLVSDRLPQGSTQRGAERIARAGALWQTRGGLLLLLNIADAPGRVQAKLARLLRDREAAVVDRRPSTVVDLDVRVIAVVEPALEADLADGRLRRDLYERLAGSRIDVPPLRRRREDIPLLAVHFLGLLGGAERGAPRRFSRAALALLSALPWPGNVRELRTVVETLVRSVSRPVIQLDDLLARVQLDGTSARVDTTGTLRDAKARFERDWISAVLLKHHGRVGEAARALGIQRTNLYRKVRQLNVARTLLASRRS
jgi:DNA-binding NtrC family response regulator